MSRFIKNHIQKMQGYISGEQPKENDVVKLNTNENPYDPPQSVFDAIQSLTGQQLKKYPPAMGQEIRESIASIYQLKSDGILLGNGSDELLTMLMRACVSPGDAVAFPDPTYVLYQTLAEIQGAKVVTIAFDKDFDLLTDDVAALDAKIFFLANPNSPSGTVIPKSKVKELAEAFDGLFVVDEAYVDFAEDNCLSLVDECKNVIVLRTMSKSFSLAGIRFGWAYGAIDLIEQLTKVKDSYNVNILTQTVALAALKSKDEIDAHVKVVKQTRNDAKQALLDRGWDVSNTQANFIWAKPPQNAADLYENLKQNKIYVRYFKELSDYLRITVGTPNEMQKLLDAIDK